MEAYAQPIAVVNALNEASHKRKRKTYSSELIEEATKAARHIGVTAASHQTFGDEKICIPYTTLKDWLHHWQEQF